MMETAGAVLLHHKRPTAFLGQSAGTLWRVVESQINAQYPECNIRAIRDTAGSVLTDRRTCERELHLHHGLFPIRRFAQFEDALNRISADPLTP